MGCPSIDCTNLTASHTITVLPDIVGIGILVSFLLTAALACGTVVFSYFVGVVPDEWLVAADYAIIRKWRRCNKCQKRYDAEVTGAGAEEIAKLKLNCKHNEPDIIDQRREGLNTFILTLSDQQLVTGLAMMIASLIRHCTLSYYEFSVVTNLAWLSSTTHLTTLVVLQPYLATRPWLRDFRIVGIFCNLVLLLYFTLVTSAAASASADGSASIQCVLDDLHHLLHGARHNFSAYVSVWFLLDSHWSAMSNIYGYRQKFWKSAMLHYCHWFLNNTRPIQGVPSIPNPDEPDQERRRHPPQRTRRFVSWRHCSGSDLVLTGDNFDEWARFWFGPPRKEFRWSRKWGLEGQRPNLLQRLGPIFEDYSMSFFSAIPIFLWSISYGITGTVISRVLKPSVDGSENEIDFGQIVPLFLMLLPMLAIAEIYYDIHKKKNKTLSQSSESLWLQVISILQAANASLPKESMPSEPVKTHDTIIEYPEPKLEDEKKQGLQAIEAAPSLEGEGKKDGRGNQEPRPQNPYQFRINRMNFYLICFYFCVLELGTGISTGLSPYYLILWATSKGVSYLGMAWSRLWFMRHIYECAFDLPRYCGGDPKAPSNPEDPSPEAALKILKLMMSDPKQKGTGNFEAADLKSMKQLLTSLRRKAAEDAAAGVDEWVGVDEESSFAQGEIRELASGPRGEVERKMSPSAHVSAVAV